MAKNPNEFSLESSKTIYKICKYLLVCEEVQNGSSFAIFQVQKPNERPEVLKSARKLDKPQSKLKSKVFQMKVMRN